MLFYDRKRFKRLSKDLYILPELLPKREIDKFLSIWSDKYGYSPPTKVILKSNVNTKEFLFTDVNNLFNKRRRKL